MKRINLTAPVKLQAKAAAGQGRKLRILAYSGGLMKVEGFGPLVIDLAGMEYDSETLPILADHQNAVAAVIGSVRPRVENGSLYLDGKAATTPAGADVVALLESGAPLQSSVGAEPLEKVWIEPGQSVKANNRTITAPESGFWFIKKSRLREVTVTPLGADGSTSVSLAAARRAASLNAAAAAKGSQMTFEEWVQEKGFDPATLSDTQREFFQTLYDEENAEGESTTEGAPMNASAAMFAPANGFNLSPTQAKRMGEISQLCETAAEAAGRPVMVQASNGQPVSLMSQAIQNNWSTDVVRQFALNHVRSSRPTPPVAGRVNGRGVTMQHLEAALMVRAGHESLALKAYGEVIMEQSRAMHRASLPDFCAAALKLRGRDVPHDRSEMIRAALSGGDWTTLLSNVAGKVLESTWRIAPATWRSWCAVRSAADFKQQTALRPTFGGKLEILPDGGTIRHNTLGEDNTFNWRVHQFAAQYAVGRQTVVNDDLNAVSEILPALSKKAMRELSDLIYSLVLANGSSFFATGNGNNQSGGSSPLSASSLATAIRQLRNQQDPDGNSLDLSPAVLVVPPALEQTARGLLSSQNVMRDQTADLQPTGNTFQGVARLEVEPRLESGVTDPVSGTTYAGSATGWYLFASPADVPLVVGFLNGKETPTIETFGFNSQPDRLEMTFRVVHDFGGALGDYRAAQRSVGA